MSTDERTALTTGADHRADDAVETPPGTTPEWLHFAAALRNRGKSFADVCGASDKRSVLGAVGITDPLDTAAVETQWAARLGANRTAAFSANGGTYGTFPPADPREACGSDVDGDGAAETDELQSSVGWAVQLSWIVNFALLVVKMAAAWLSGSQSVLASLADSAVDLVSQGVLASAESAVSQADDDYPVGRSRLEALAVMACAGIMSMASAFVVQSAASVLSLGLRRVHPIRAQLTLTESMLVVLVGGTVAKALLWVYCRRFSKDNASLAALAEDHLNDVVSNTAAILAAVVTAHARQYWWVDPATAILVSAWIIYRWYLLTVEQMGKLVGKTAPPAFISKVNGIASRHHPLLRVDVTRAYHVGARFAVEMEVVLPPQMTLRESHDIALNLQHRIEALADCERAFVHVDYAFREAPEHKVERELGTTGGHAKATPMQSLQASPHVDGGTSVAVSGGVLAASSSRDRE